MIDATVFDWLYNAGRWTWHDPDGYNFISGPLADITLIGGAYAILRRHNCHVKGCLRIGRHPVAGTTYIVCRKHHPDETPTADQVLAAHDAHTATERAMKEARLTRAAVVHDVDKVAHEVAADVHEVAEDVRSGQTPDADPDPQDGPGQQE